jgi:hypothetical protein
VKNLGVYSNGRQAEIAPAVGASLSLLEDSGVMTGLRKRGVQNE